MNLLITQYYTINIKNSIVRILSLRIASSDLKVIHTQSTVIIYVTLDIILFPIPIIGLKSTKSEHLTRKVSEIEAYNTLFEHETYRSDFVKKQKKPEFTRKIWIFHLDEVYFIEILVKKHII